MKDSIPFFFYPTRKILLDDDKIFTQSILLKMHGKNFSAINSTTDALKYFSDEYCPNVRNKNVIDLTRTAESLLTQHSSHIKFDSDRINDSHQEISMLFIDYHMPEMHGLDFLKKITSSPFKKVLMTGEQDYEIAVNAFNNGLIDAYLRKGEPDFLIKLNRITSELEWKYFTDLSQVISYFPDLDYLKNANIIKLFMQFFSDKKITHFNLIDKQGTFCAHNIAGEKEYFILRKITQLKQLSEFAEEDGASLDVVNKIADGKCIPFFEMKEHWEIPASEWSSYLYSANELCDDPDFLWATVKTDAEIFDKSAFL